MWFHSIDAVFFTVCGSEVMMPRCVAGKDATEELRARKMALLMAFRNEQGILFLGFADRKAIGSISL
jgi:hypothetical protein